VISVGSISSSQCIISSSSPCPHHGQAPQAVPPAETQLSRPGRPSKVAGLFHESLILQPSRPRLPLHSIRNHNHLHRRHRRTESLRLHPHQIAQSCTRLIRHSAVTLSTGSDRFAWSEKQAQEVGVVSSRSGFGTLSANDIRRFDKTSCIDGQTRRARGQRKHNGVFASHSQFPEDRRQARPPSSRY
jgi:hypothetical protein